MDSLQRLKALLNTVEELLVEAKGLSEDTLSNDQKAKFDELASACIKLDAELQRVGTPVRHSNTMVENRGVPPSDPEFYRHIHAAQDLAAFARDVINKGN